MSAMKDAPCSCRTRMNRIDESLKASVSRIFSSPGMPKTYSTPSVSRHCTIKAATDFVCSLLSTFATIVLLGHDIEPIRSMGKNMYALAVGTERAVLNRSDDAIYLLDSLELDS